MLKVSFRFFSSPMMSFPKSSEMRPSEDQKCVLVFSAQHITKKLYSRNVQLSKKNFVHTVRISDVWLGISCQLLTSAEKRVISFLQKQQQRKNWKTWLLGQNVQFSAPTLTNQTLQITFNVLFENNESNEACVSERWTFCNDGFNPILKEFSFFGGGATITVLLQPHCSGASTQAHSHWHAPSWFPQTLFGSRALYWPSAWMCNGNQ